MKNKKQDILKGLGSGAWATLDNKTDFEARYYKLHEGKLYYSDDCGKNWKESINSVESFNWEKFKIV